MAWNDGHQGPGFSDAGPFGDEAVSDPVDLLSGGIAAHAMAFAGGQGVASRTVVAPQEAFGIRVVQGIAASVEQDQIAVFPEVDLRERDADFIERDASAHDDFFQGFGPFQGEVDGDVEAARAGEDQLWGGEDGFALTGAREPFGAFLRFGIVFRGGGEQASALVVERDVGPEVAGSGDVADGFDPFLLSFQFS